MGEYQHALDDKGRLTMPAKLREELGDVFIITRGLDRCLYVYPRQEWDVLIAKIKELPTTQAEVRAFVRVLLAGAVEAEMDKQGRVGIPANLRAYAGIERDMVITGVLTHVEIWSAENWAPYSEQIESGYSEMAQKIVGLDI